MTWKCSATITEECLVLSLWLEYSLHLLFLDRCHGDPLLKGIRTIEHHVSLQQQHPWRTGMNATLWVVTLGTLL